jgi:uncharacterized protein (TIGR00251 family)
MGGGKVREFKITDAKQGAAFTVHVVTRASKNEIAGRMGDVIKVRLTAPPVEGKANKALIAFLARRLGVHKSQVEIVAGKTSRDKVISVLDLSPVEVEERLLG